LAAEGMTNRAIAQALRVAPKTVERHLTHIYKKLGIASREELPDLPDAGGGPPP
jgi:DNA-binding NarL/FixJ family response regulator